MKKNFGVIFSAVILAVCTTGCQNDEAVTTKVTDVVTTVPSVTEVFTSESATTTEHGGCLPATTTEITAPISVTNTETTAIRENSEIPVVFRSALLYCVDTDNLLYDCQISKRVYPASLTKLLTALVAVRYCSLDTCFTVGNELDSVSENSSLCLIQKGHILSLYDLLCGLLIESGNDAAYTIAVNVARNVTGNKKLPAKEAVRKFCLLMNSYAKGIGMVGSSFDNPDGRDSKGTYTTAYDLLLLTKRALSVPEIKEIVSSKEKYVVFKSGQNITWKNTNKLMQEDSEYYRSTVSGVKTGTTESAGNCLITTYTSNGKQYIAVIMGCKNDDDRYKTAIRFMNNYK